MNIKKKIKFVNRKALDFTDLDNGVISKTEASLSSCFHTCQQKWKFFKSGCILLIAFLIAEQKMTILSKI